ncbi:putative arylsulfatase I [Apostichopus japonicus]|uniref:Putative arylsulfatase I n=1 Tax=Stichopus japonicus TaxID=307972 RepID=A0A2G8KWG8_STIJA|nr:putative arylsulfatase I [Apostichopus japonicus]
MTQYRSLITFLNCWILCSLSASSNQLKPNIILIVADDLGWNDVSFHGSSQIPTPHLDELAYNGIILSNYYVSPICTPTRGALMTGRHPIHLGLQHETIHPAAPYGLPLNETTVATALKGLGYKTRMVGKWHLGFFEDAYTPINRGFDSHIGYYSGKEDYYNHCNDEDGWLGYDFFKDGTPYKPTFGQYSTEIYTQAAEDIIRNHSKNQSEPLFLYFAHQSVHSANNDQPLQVPERYLEKFKDIHHEGRRTYAAMVSILDESVKNLTETLMDVGMLNNSVIIFTSDNGGPANGFDVNFASNFPLRGVKATLWEGGVRGAAFVHSPLIKSSPRISNGMFHVCDWFPTFIDIGGGDPSKFSNLDGTSQWQSLKSGTKSPRTEILHNIDPIYNVSALRWMDFKVIIGDTYQGNWSGWYPPEQVTDIFSVEADPRALVVQCPNKPSNASTNCNPFKAPCLYNITHDPCEYFNIADENPDVVKSLLDKLEKYQSTMIPPGNKPIVDAANPYLHGGNWEPWVQPDMTVVKLRP